MTPLIKIDNLYFKREDLNPTGSAKDRALPFQIENLISSGYQSAVISSTGNAAISASYFCNEASIPLTIFVSPKINAAKLALINGKIIKSSQPISQAIKFSKASHSYLLRQSTDPSAQIGYSEIAKELLTDLPKITSIFIPVGSGTTLLGISKILPNNVKIFAVQPASNPTICSRFDSTYTPETETITDALSVKYLPLKNEIINKIKNHGGSGIIVSNEQAINSLDFIKQFNASPESALTLAGFYQAQEKFEVGNYPVILLTGTNR